MSRPTATARTPHRHNPARCMTDREGKPAGECRRPQPRAARGPDRAGDRQPFEHRDAPRRLVQPGSDHAEVAESDHELEAADDHEEWREGTEQRERREHEAEREPGLSHAAPPAQEARAARRSAGTSRACRASRGTAGRRTRQPRRTRTARRRAACRASTSDRRRQERGRAPRSSTAGPSVPYRLAITPTPSTSAAASDATFRP